MVSRATASWFALGAGAIPCRELWDAGVIDEMLVLEGRKKCHRGWAGMALFAEKSRDGGI